MLAVTVAAGTLVGSFAVAFTIRVLDGAKVALLSRSG